MCRIKYDPPELLFTQARGGADEHEKAKACLYLNIYSPFVDSAKNEDKKEKLPVIFWIHGGGNIDGASDGYDGSKLATQGKVVVVTINCRLGLLGFIAHPSLDSEGHLFGN